MGQELPAVSIGFCDPMWPSDSGLSVIYADAPDPSEVRGPDDPRVGLVHVDCLVSDDPGLVAGFEIARAFGVADLEGGVWVVGDVSRLATTN